MTLVYLDCETTGLDPDLHEVWEIAYAVDDGPVNSGCVMHNAVGADPEALRLNRYFDRFNGDDYFHDALRFEFDVRQALTGATVVAANPSFDTAMLRARWGCELWHHRKIDIETFALPLLGLKQGRPRGLADIAAALHIQAPDHTAAGDVYTLRECYRALWAKYDALHAATPRGPE